MELSKSAIRLNLRERRRRLDWQCVQGAGDAAAVFLRALPELSSARGLWAYLANENEVPTEAAIAVARAAGLITYLPKTPGGMAEWQPGDRLQAGRGGTLEPAAEPARELPLPAIALVPLVAWDEQGTRLGRGGGFYDQLFASVGLGAPVTRVGLAYEFQCVPALPRDAWDVSLDYVITERRIVRCQSGDTVERLQEGGLRV